MRAMYQTVLIICGSTKTLESQAIFTILKETDSWKGGICPNSPSTSLKKDGFSLMLNKTKKLIRNFSFYGKN